MDAVLIHLMGWDIGYTKGETQGGGWKQTKNNMTFTSQSSQKCAIATNDNKTNKDKWLNMDDFH